MLRIRLSLAAVYMLEWTSGPLPLIGLSKKDLFDINNLEFVIDEIRKFLDEEDMRGRISTEPVLASTMFKYAALEYGIKWMYGEVSGDDIDLVILERIMVDFIARYSGEEGLGVSLSLREKDGSVYSHYILVDMDFIVY